VFKDPIHEQAHRHSSRHRAEILTSEKCGCFCCGKIFPPSAIQEWVDDDHKGLGQTALCPTCGVDAVLGDRSGFPITAKFLRAMKTAWFS
jgi:hypothetical protein